MDASDQQPTVAQVETDLFCNECGFNLHAQRVWRDERLGLLLCRCPECGRHHPAGQVVSATRPWLRRLGIAVLAAWVLGVIALVLVIGCVQFGLFIGHHENFCGYGRMTLDGQVVTNVWTSDGDGGMVQRTYLDGVETDAAALNKVPTLHTMIPPGMYGRDGMWEDEGAIVFTFLSLGFAASVAVQGTLLALALWHRKRWHAWTVGVVVQLLAAAAFLAIVWYEQSMTLTAPWMTRWVGVYLVLGLATLAVTVVVAKPLTRAVLTLFLPVQSRRVFGFLWSADAKPLP